MIKRKVRLEEILILSTELSGGHLGGTPIDGVIKQKLSVRGRFYVNMLINTIAPLVNRINESRETISKTVFGDDQINIEDPRIIECEKLYIEFLQEIWDLEYRPIPLNSINDIDMGDEYQVIFNFMSEE